MNKNEATETLLPKKYLRNRRLPANTNIGDQSKIRSNFDKYYEEVDPKLAKYNNKFLFKVYLHILCQAIILFGMLFISFNIPLFHKILIENNLIFYIILIILLITFIQPLISDQLLKNKPQNYIFLLVFTLCICYALCKQAILFDFYLIMIMSLLNIIEIIYLTIESYFASKNEKSIEDIANTMTFMGLTLLFIGSILCFYKNISIIQFSIILVILLALGVYINYDINCIYTNKRRKYLNNDYVLAVVFLYIDIFHTVLELLEKFYNSCEPERRTSRRSNKGKSMIYTGDESYEKFYKNENDEVEKNTKNTNEVNRTHHRRLSSSNIQSKLPPIGEKVIFEEDKEEEEEKEEGDNLLKDEKSDDSNDEKEIEIQKDKEDEKE